MDDFSVDLHFVALDDVVVFQVLNVSGVFVVGGDVNEASCAGFRKHDKDDKDDKDDLREEFFHGEG
ncbi:MAG: hypothetical protein U1C97_00185 [Candidatus Gracilibacteria bacterium]|nr:hypothetical protein [Candidatus Gracilibacteria bacterium]